MHAKGNDTVEWRVSGVKWRVSGAMESNVSNGGYQVQGFS